MFKYKVLLFTLFVVISQAFAQKDPMKLGDVDEADVKATKYDKFPDAEAIVLCDYGVVDYDLSASNTRQNSTYMMRIKVLKKSGYERANKRITYQSYNGSKRHIHNIEGYTYNYENGKVVRTKLEKSAITRKAIDANTTEVKFSMPNVKEGSVIEYSYDLVSDFHWYIPTWYFQTDLPVLWSEYRVCIPEYFEFVQFSQVYQKMHEQEKRSITRTFAGSTTTYSNEAYRWVLTNIPPFKNEPFIASVNDCIMKISFQKVANYNEEEGRKPFLETWDKLIKNLLNDTHFGGYIQKNLPDKLLVQNLVKDKKATKDKVIAIYDYVKQSIKCNGDLGIHTGKSIKEVLDKKVGSVAEVNLLLLNMLREINIKAFPVLLSTRNNGKLFYQYPLRDKFNYVVIYVNIDDKEKILLDATDDMLVADMLSYNALNEAGLLVEPIKGEGKETWIPLQASKNAKMSNIISANLNMDQAGTVRGEITERFGGYEAIRMRKKLLKEANTDESTKEEDEKINKFTWKGLETLEKPLDGVKNVEITEFSQVNDDFIYFTPLLDYRMKENPFKNVEREFPIDYACLVEKSFYMNFTIPEGYKVEELPKPLRIKWQDESVKFDYAITATDNKIQLISKFVLSRPLFAPQEYKALRDLYAQIVAKQEEQIVLKKK